MWRPHFSHMSEIEFSCFRKSPQQPFFPICGDPISPICQQIHAFFATKPLHSELTILSGCIVRSRFALRELSLSGRMLGPMRTAELLNALRECPLEALDLTGNEICVSASQIVQHGASGGNHPDPFDASALRLVCAMAERGTLRRLRLKGNAILGARAYTAEGVQLVVSALQSAECRQVSRKWHTRRTQVAHRSHTRLTHKAHTTPCSHMPRPIFSIYHRIHF